MAFNKMMTYSALAIIGNGHSWDPQEMIRSQIFSHGMVFHKLINQTLVNRKVSHCQSRAAYTAKLELHIV